MLKAINERKEGLVMRRFFLAVAIASGLAAFGVPAQAQLLGTTVTGSLVLATVPSVNFYDPNNVIFDLVPPGYDNFTANSPTVTIDANMEFGYNDQASLITADFTDNTLTLTDTVSAGVDSAWEQTFTDTALSGLTLTNVTDSFGLSSATLSGDVITIDWPGIQDPDALATEFSATFNLTGSTLPEPASLTLLASGLAGLAALRRRRWR
jgi:hypothetical protein